MSMLLLLLVVCTGRRCSAKETVFVSLPNFWCLERRFGLNRISHPDWVKLCVELNCVPNKNTFCYKLTKQALTLLNELPIMTKNKQSVLMTVYLWPLVIVTIYLQLNWLGLQNTLPQRVSRT